MALVPFSNRCGTPQSTPFRGPASLLAHRLMSTPLWGSASPTNVGSHNPPPFGAQRPRWHLFPSLINVGPLNLPPFRAQHPCWHTASCPLPFGVQPPQLMWDLTIHPPSEPSVLAGTRSLLQSTWDPLIYPLSGPSILAGTPPCVYPHRGSTSSLAHRLVSDSDTIWYSPNPPLPHIILFGLSLSGFPSRFLKCVC